jgi:hypothetical protein
LCQSSFGDWHSLKKGIVTGSSAEIVLRSFASPQFISKFFDSNPTQGDEDMVFQKLCDSWFRYPDSTNFMRKGLENEELVKKRLRLVFPKIGNIYSLGLVELDPLIGVSVDGVCFLKGDDDTALPTIIEIKSVFNGDSVRRAEAVSLDENVNTIINVDFGTERWKKLIPSSHRAQLVHQMYVCNIKSLLYVVATPQKIIYVAKVSISEADLEEYGLSMKRISMYLKIFALNGEDLPANIPREYKWMFTQHLEFWRPLYEKVKEKGAYNPPIRQFRSAAQMVYSGLKYPVDTIGQTVAKMRKPHRNAEQAMLLMILNIAVANSHTLFKFFSAREEQGQGRKETQKNISYLKDSDYISYLVKLGEMLIKPALLRGVSSPKQMNRQEEIAFKGAIQELQKEGEVLAFAKSSPSIQESAEFPKILRRLLSDS